MEVAADDAGLIDRSSRPDRMPTRTSPEVEAAVLATRVEHRRGQDWLGPELGVPAAVCVALCGSMPIITIAVLQSLGWDRGGHP
jgi:leucine-zipper of insertion element IS481